MNLTNKILKKHLLQGDMSVGSEISLRIDQTLTQDATGTMAWLQFETFGIPKVQTELSVSYVDHNTLQMGFRNSDDHRFLRTSAAHFGAVYSPPGTGICHQLHLENFACPGKTLLGSDSHTPTAGGIGSIALGAGGLSVALAMAGEAYSLHMPRVVEVRLTGKLQGFAQAKDVILYLLKLLLVEGGVGRIFEYTGKGVDTLSIPERATITNMGAELGASTSIFPSDDRTREFLKAMGREQDWIPLCADEGASYDERVEIDLSLLVPMAAQPHMPDRVVPVSELVGIKVDQVAMGSCTNSSYADLKTVAQIMKGKQVAPSTDVSVSPGSKQVLSMLMKDGSMNIMLDAGVRLLECTCGPCIGMGASPISHGVSVRTFNRNFEGRSGTKDAQAYLVSPVTAAYCAIAGEFTDPSTWGTPLIPVDFPKEIPSIKHLFAFPDQNVNNGKNAQNIEILRGPNIVALEQFDPLPEHLTAQIILKVGDDITTDHIMPAGAEITSLRSNIPAISEYVFSRVDEAFVIRAKALREKNKAGIIVAGSNYGQGSSREHAALAPRHLGIRAVLALSFARIHRANLINFGILPFLIKDIKDYENFCLGDEVQIDLRNLSSSSEVIAHITNGINGTNATNGINAIKNEKKEKIILTHNLSTNELRQLMAGGLLNDVRNRKK